MGDNSQQMETYLHVIIAIHITHISYIISVKNKMLNLRMFFFSNVDKYAKESEFLDLAKIILCVRFFL